MSKRRTLFICLGALLVFALFLALCGRKLTVSAEGDVAKVGETNYTSFSDALANWTDGTTLHLLSNCSAPEGVRVEGNKTLDLMGYTLSGDKTRTIWIEKGAKLTIKDSATTGKITGGGIRVEGELSIESGTITENSSADDGGGIFVLAGGKLVMTGGKITGNTAAGRGGGVFAEGEVSLDGEAVISENVGKDGMRSDLYLPAGNPIEVKENFMGSVGVQLSSLEGILSQNFKEGFFADDPLYETRNTDGRLELRLSPLTTVTASYTGEETLFPTTGLERLSNRLDMTLLNGNGVEYPREYVRSQKLRKEDGSEGDLAVGENVIELELTGRDGETAMASFTVNVSVPALLKAELSYTQNRVFRFDSTLSIDDFRDDLKVIGLYEDNREREIFPTSEETSAQNGGYITDHYELSGDFSELSGGKATMTVTIPHGESPIICEFSVDVMKYTLYTSEIAVSEVKIAEGEETRVTAEDFVPSLPQGVNARVRLKGTDGELDSSALTFGIYHVEVLFSSADGDKFEVMGPLKETKLLVYTTVYEGTADGVSYSVTCPEGISPEWSFSMEKKDSKAYLRNGLSVGSMFEFTFFPWESEDIPQIFVVKLVPEGHLAERDKLYLFRVNEDGSTEEVLSGRENGYLIFETDDLNESTFLIAVENNDNLLIILSVCFAVLCVGCAVGFGVYLKKRK